MEHWRILEALDRPARSLGVLPELAALRPQFKIHVLDTLPSTSQHAWDLVGQGLGAGTVVVACQQSAGRGQWGRTWISPPGGLYLSLVLEPDVALCDRLLLTFASAWGIATCLENLGINIQLKWPNDLVSQGCKVGGILTETRLGSPNTPCPDNANRDNANARIQTAVVGVGLNWLNPLPQNAMSLRQLLPESPPDSLQSLEGLTAIVLRGVLQGYYYWQHRGRESLIEAYQSKLCHLHQVVTVNGRRVRVSGISLAGDLLVNLDTSEPGELRSFKLGEIRLGYLSGHSNPPEL